MENYGTTTREEFPYGEAADRYWNDYVDRLMAEVKHYDYEVELHTKYRPKNVTNPKDAFVHLFELKIKKENAFLLKSIGTYRKWRYMKH